MKASAMGSWRGRAAAAALVAAGLAVGGAAIAGPHGGGCGEGGGGLAHLERRVARADLPAETSQAIYQRIDQARAEDRTIEAALADAREKMRELLEQDSTNTDAVMAQADAVGALETQRRKLGLKALAEIRALVTPEQWRDLAPGEDRRGFSRRSDRGA